MLSTLAFSDVISVQYRVGVLILQIFHLDFRTADEAIGMLLRHGDNKIVELDIFTLFDYSISCDLLTGLALTGFHTAVVILSIESMISSQTPSFRHSCAGMSQSLAFLRDNVAAGMRVCAMIKSRIRFKIFL